VRQLRGRGASQRSRCSRRPGRCAVRPIHRYPARTHFEPCNLVLQSRAAINGYHARRRRLRAAPVRARCSQSALNRPGLTTDEATRYHKTMSNESVRREPVSRSPRNALRPNTFRDGQKCAVSCGAGRRWDLTVTLSRHISRLWSKSSIVSRGGRYGWSRRLE
jgi:hypothetical protein